MFTIFLLLLLFQVKHFICDYPLQTEYMLGKMKAKGWIKPLAAHCGVHAIGTGLIVLFFAPSLIIPLMIMDFTLHFIVDRLKASPNIGGAFKPDQPYFWWALGLDQMAHHLINYVFIAVILIYNS